MWRPFEERLSRGICSVERSWDMLQMYVPVILNQVPCSHYSALQFSHLVYGLYYVVIIPSPVHLTSQKAWVLCWDPMELPGASHCASTISLQRKGKKEQFNMNGWLIVMVNSG